MGRRKKAILGAAGVVLVILALPLINLVSPTDNRALMPARLDDVPRWNEVRAVLGRKCVHCHAANPKLPFYASLPVARGLIQKDLRQGRAIFDAPQELYRKTPAPVSEAALAKLEFALTHDTMPPTRYLLLNWNQALSRSEKALLEAWIADLRRLYFRSPGVAKAFETGPLQPLPPPERLDPAKVALGRALFHDKRLSKDRSLSCASCHALNLGGTDRMRFSVGVDNQLGGINSPTVFNAVYHLAQFWDGRAADLEAQAAGPVANPIEMGATWPDVVARLRQDPDLTARMRSAYPEGLTARTIRNAIATFERSLVTPSRFDRFLRGQPGALTALEREGYDAFVKRGCSMCHVGKILGGQSYERMGLYRDYFAGRKSTAADRGRMGVTGREQDRHRFKVPTLRNIAITAPYFHDGRTSKLEEAVAIMASHQLPERPTASEQRALVAFLRSLTGTYQGSLLK